jgi:hypothetical protein
MMKFKKRAAVGHQITRYILIQMIFTLLWALIFFALYPQLQSFQASFCPSDCYDAAQSIFMNSLIFSFPLVIEFGSTFWLWNHSQRKRGAEDIPVFG